MKELAYTYEHMLADLKALVAKYEKAKRPPIPAVNKNMVVETAQRYGTTGMIKAFRFMRNTEAAVDPFYLPMLQGRGNAPIEEFGEIWNKEETYHAERLDEVEEWLSQELKIKRQSSQDFISEVRWRYYLDYAQTGAAHVILGTKFVFLHMLIGLIQEITATTGYNLMAQKLLPLSDFFEGFAKQERLHISFYAGALEIIMNFLKQSRSGRLLINYAPYFVSKVLSPVGVSLQPNLSKPAMSYIFSGQESPQMLGANLKRLIAIYPGHAWADIIKRRINTVIA